MFRHLNPFGKLSLSLLLIVICGVGMFLLSALLAIPLFDINYFNNPDLASSFSNVALAKFFQITNSIGIFVLPAFLIAYWFESRPAVFLQLNFVPQGISVLIVSLTMFTLLPFIEMLATWNAQLSLPESLASLEYWMKQTEKSAMELTLKFLKMDDVGDLALNFFMIAIIPAIGEELLFRGVIQRYLGDWVKNKHIAIWVTAFAFSALHMQFYGFLPRFLLGIYLGYLLVWSGNLWYPILGHLINNGTAVIAYYFYQDKLDEQVANPEILPQMPWLVISSMFITVFLMLIFIKKQRDLALS
jgi:uncharacterized protein